MYDDSDGDDDDDDKLYPHEKFAPGFANTWDVGNTFMQLFAYCTELF